MLVGRDGLGGQLATEPVEFLDQNHSPPEPRRG
jgi:hypothetical protein